ncbi:MAG TPA: hypothetical protein VLG50_00670 [Candidatus Saccharimonadales bacterium]|nr:hypothetical protein [Candidatus Saccharimonadales bacterium]
MKKLILLASFLLCSTAAFCSEKQEQTASQQQYEQVKQTSDTQVLLTVLQKDNESLRRELTEANKPAYFKNTLIFFVGAASGAFIGTIATTAFWAIILGDMKRY